LPLFLKLTPSFHKTGATFGTTVNSANIISFLRVLFLIFFKKKWKVEQLEEMA